MKPINTSIYDFPTLITGGYVYVDKTAVLYELANATGTENFRSWSLMVNERPSGGIKLKFADGKLKVVPGGLLLILK